MKGLVANWGAGERCFRNRLQFVSSVRVQSRNGGPAFLSFRVLDSGRELDCSCNWEIAQQSTIHSLTAFGTTTAVLSMSIVLNPGGKSTRQVHM